LHVSRCRVGQPLANRECVASVVWVWRACRACSADFQTISMCRNRCEPRRFSERGCVRSTSRSALERPKAWDSIQRPGKFAAAAAGPADTAALHLVAALPRCAVSQFSSLPSAACAQRSADYKSALRKTDAQPLAGELAGKRPARGRQHSAGRMPVNREIVVQVR